MTIRRRVDEVFNFYREFENLPRFLGDVMAVRRTGPTTSRWTIEGPLGIRANWTIKVTEERRNELIRYETVTVPALKTYWEIQFIPSMETGETEVHEMMKVPFGKLGRVALTIVGKFPSEEVRANLNRLKQLLETGSITDRRYSARGKSF